MAGSARAGVRAGRVELMQSILARLKTALALFSVCLLTFVLIDVAARITVRMIDGVQGRLASSVDPRSQSAAYADSAYEAERLFDEERAADARMYRPYVVWSRKPYEGELIRIDEAGERHSISGRVEDPDLVVWMLGGSTTWGLGAPDDETMPSHLTRLLQDENGVRARVRNLGEIGFVSTQEIVRMLRELQRGGRPDLVVFLDGVNDAAAAALWPDIPGSHMNFYEIRDRFERRGGPPPAWKTLIKQSGIYRLSRRIARMLSYRGRPAPVPWNPPQDPAEIESRGRQGIDVWLENMRLVRAFAGAHDFEYLFLLQPSLMVGDKILDPSEQEVLASERENAAKVQSMDVYRVMREELRRRLAEGSLRGTPIYDLSDAFGNVAEPLYFDYVHISGEGNRILAKRIHASIVDRVCRDGGSPPSARLGALCNAAQPGEPAG